MPTVARRIHWAPPTFRIKALVASVNSCAPGTSNMGNANQHSHVNVGQLIVGGAMGRHKPARLNLMETGPTSNFLLSVLHLYGIEQASIGDSTQAVSLT